jgi:hypothetical protein
MLAASGAIDGVRAGKISVAVRYFFMTYSVIGFLLFNESAETSTATNDAVKTTKLTRTTLKENLILLFIKSTLRIHH